MREQYRAQKFQEIREQLRQHYPTLHLADENGQWIIKGSFPVRVQAEIVDHFLVAILIPKGFPKQPPLVKELGGRIKHHPDWHVYQEGLLCLFSPLERWKHLPKTATIITYLEGALNDYLFSQTYFEQYRQWPFGERGHGGTGLKEYLSEELQTDDTAVMRRFLEYLSNDCLKGHWHCYCGSGKKLRYCHFDLILDLHQKITPSEAQYALRVFDQMMKGQ